MDDWLENEYTNYLPVTLLQLKLKESDPTSSVTV